MSHKKIVFCDRDGVINEESKDYIKTLKDFRFIPGSLDAIKMLSDYGYDIIVITNQSAIGRNLTSASAVAEIHEYMQKKISDAGGTLLDIFYCPHTPQDACECRKPKPGLIFQAQKKYGIDLASAVMIGDSARDIACAQKAGVGRAILVLTGYGKLEKQRPSNKGIFPNFIASDFSAAAEWIVTNAPTS
jgi:D-glycero-D-manno-heptose 1,7-bisphosphate phosphatase